MSRSISITYGVASQQSPKHPMQDRQVAIVDASSLPEVSSRFQQAFAPDAQPSFFAVYDGHGNLGGEVSTFVKNNLHINLFNALTQTSSVPQAIKAAVHKTDEDIAKQLHEGGSCALFGLLIGRDLYVANIGDSRGIYYEADEPILPDAPTTPNDEPRLVPLSRDHAAASPREHARIARNGGTVTSHGRIFGLLPSRTLGDHDRKEMGNYRMVISEPEISSVTVVSNSFMILATDGVWDVIDNEQAAQFIQDRLRDKETPERAASSLVTECVNRGSKDDVSVVLVCFT
eukprot:GILK01009276.1.p1 GENE.GILK01009276.1~~GILK01009276.1.p1  ORF type:complete len:288 (-),score=34.75 GILK01009276.1:139-1002(-)